ncbi:hypothetical protein BG003_009146 [Podila horticola]|nr:hypothetical protein BG003_009146 [Podila horticola]
MHLAVLQAMSRIQRFKYETARILHQEHALEASLDRRPTLYDRLTFEASTTSRRLFHQSRSKSDSPQRSSSLANSTTGGRIQNRSDYWIAQAQFLVGAMSAGTTYEPKTDRPQDSQGIQDHRKPIETTRDPLHHLDHDEEEQDQDQEVVTLPSSSSSLTSTSSVSLTTVAHSTSLTAANNEILETDGKLEPLLMSRIQSMVDLIFDPCLVQLGYRRAIINCARYVSANIDETFPKAADVNRPTELYDPVLYSKFQEMCTIKLGPYLSMLTPIQFDDDGLELSVREQDLLERVVSDTIEPPKRLANYFHMMLWHRCMHDLIAIYNKIQHQHTRLAPRKKREEPPKAVVETPVCCQDSPSPSPLTQTSAEASSFPFCCDAHSLVFTARYPTSVVPYSVRLRFRRVAHKVQVVSQHAMWLVAMGGIHRTGSISSLQMDRMPPGQRVIKNLGCNNRIQFCNGSVRPPTLTHPSPSPGTVYPLDEIQQRQLQRQIEDEMMLRRRHQVEERMKQDNLIKQELLGLCHMACGLFLVPSPMLGPADAPPTIMSLLRYGSPWNKGVWREGEWRHDPIELGYSSGGDGKTSNMSGSSKSGQENLMDQGPWQKMCIAAIQFLAHEDLAWGGSKTNAELSRLRATSNSNAWIYHE